MTLSKQLKQQPRLIAEQIVKNLDENELFEKPSLAGPGFINFRLQKSFLESQLNEMKSDLMQASLARQRSKK